MQYDPDFLGYMVGVLPILKVQGEALLSKPRIEHIWFSNKISAFLGGIQNMFENDRSAAKGLMSARRLIIFKHSSLMGNAACRSFNLVKAERTTIR